MTLLGKLKDAVDVDKIKGAVDDVVDKSKSAVGDNAGKINSVIDTVTSTADARTGGKYSERITKAAESAKGGVSSFGGTDPAAAETVEPVAEIPDADVVEEV